MTKLFKLSLCAILLCTGQISFAQSPNFNLQLRSSMTFPGQTLANVCGYWQDGREYALLGGSKGMIIVDITNPAAPVQIVQLPSPEGNENNGSLWKEIKVYKQYAYLVTEAGGGLQIIDLSALPSPNLTHHLYTGDGAIGGQLDDTHALHIDVTKGYLYIYGGPLFAGGAKIFDLNQDPYNPKYVGKFNQELYVHDGYVDNDTLYSCHINSGIMSIVDVSNKANPALLGTVETPGKFTHNSWITDDRKHVLTTDETVPSFLTAYDVSDPSDIQELDRVSPNNGYGSYVHNTHILNDYAVTSWYTDGVMVVDAHRPQNLVIVGAYDTYAGSALEFEGCWGTFPFFPSGTIITTDITPAKLTVLTPNYQRACYFEGTVINGCNGQPLVGATVKINGSNDPVKISTTKANGTFRTGQATPGNFTATITAPGFQSQTVNITLVAGQVTTMDIVIGGNAFNASGVVVEAGTGTPIPFAAVTIKNALNTYQVTADANGQFSVECVPASNYAVSAAKWEYLPGTASLNSATPVQVQLAKGYYDDFGQDLGWTTENNADAGAWVREDPIGTTNQNNLVNPENDASQDNNDLCYMTANGGGQAGSNDVDNGIVALNSPVMKLAGYQDAVLSYYFWFYNALTQGNPANDLMEVNILNGNQTVNILTETVSQSAWRFSGEIHLKDYITLTDNVRIQFLVNDLAPGNWLEGAVDIFKVVPVAAVGTESAIDATATIQVSPNPSADAFAVLYAWENAAASPSLEVRNLLGQVVLTQQLNAKTGIANIGSNLTPGVYTVQLNSGTQMSSPIKLVKQ